MDILIFILLAFSLAPIGWLLDKYTWNKGICRENGQPWIYFDTDSQGGRGYKSGKYVCWISWPFIDGCRGSFKQRDRREG